MSEAEELTTNSGVLTSITDFIELVANQGVKIGGAADTTNLQFYSANDTTTGIYNAQVVVNANIVSVTANNTLH